MPLRDIPSLGVVASLGTFASAFISRPIGALVFGHFGDRIGRKRVLVATLLLMGVSTLGVGLIPGATTIGAAAPLLLTLLRLAQGFAVGGGWAGSALLTAEHVPADKRGFDGMFTQLGYGTALILANLVFLVVYSMTPASSTAFLDWAWRIPFVLSAGLIVTALVVRRCQGDSGLCRGARHGPQRGSHQGHAARTTSGVPARRRRGDRRSRSGIRGGSLLHPLRHRAPRLLHRPRPVGRVTRWTVHGRIRRSLGHAQRLLRTQGADHGRLRPGGAVVAGGVLVDRDPQRFTVRSRNRVDLRNHRGRIGPDDIAFIPETFDALPLHRGSARARTPAGFSAAVCRR